MASKYELSAADRQFAEEFMRNPVGIHSPGLHRVLTRMRGGPLEGKLVLVCTRPHREWVLAELTGRGKPLKFHRDVVYRDLEQAEHDVFRRRWKQLTGEAL